jgi:hypothetical protein
MTQSTRYLWARASYWFLFIIAPIIAVSFWVGGGIGIIGLLIVLVVIGEHGFRPWKRLWKVE